MKRFLVLGALLSVVLMATSALAWEFSMTGKFDWDTEYGAQMGRNGFFGPFDQDNSTATASWPAGTDSNLNFWFGRRGIVSGADALRNRQKTYFNPEIRINEAVRLRGVYKIGGEAVINGSSNSINPYTGLGTFADSCYVQSQVPGTDTGMATGEWTQFWASARTPFGTVVVGKRPFIFGNGLMFNGEEVTTTESFFFSVPYGPLTFITGLYVKPAAGRYNSWALPTGSTAASSPFFSGTAGNGAVAGSANTLAGNLALYAYNRPWDASSVYEEYVGAVTYRSGSLETGAIFFLDPTLHFGPEFRRDTVTVRAGTLSEDITDWFGLAYMKYANCRFFLNADVDWWYQMNKFSGPSTGTIGGVAVGTTLAASTRPTYIDSVAYMVETGCMVGPSKLSLLYYHRPGQDRRSNMDGTGVHNALNDSQAYFASANLASTGVTRPYSFLLGWTYGSGVGAIDANGHGYFNDATVVAGRLDYAVGANLNVWGSALYAERANVSGWGMGCLSPRGSSTIFTSDSLTQRTWRSTDTPTNNTNPNIPDPSLGYEFGLGMNWSLLQGYTWNLQSNYWMPGKWFSYACLDRSVNGWNTGFGDFQAGGSAYGTVPSRTIDPVVSVYSNFVFDF